MGCQLAFWLSPRFDRQQLLSRSRRHENQSRRPSVMIAASSGLLHAGFTPGLRGLKWPAHRRSVRGTSNLRNRGAPVGLPSGPSTPSGRQLLMYRGLGLLGCRHLFRGAGHGLRSVSFRALLRRFSNTCCSRSPSATASRGTSGAMLICVLFSLSGWPPSTASAAGRHSDPRESAAGCRQCRRAE